MPELILGTAQFGAAYGITNAVGRLDDDELVAILRSATESGVDLFDTSPGYGDAQRRLGRLNPSPASRYVSKFALADDGSAPDGESVYGKTLRELDRASLEGMLFHRTADIRDARAADAWDLLRIARDEGRIARIGVSIYDADDLNIAAERFPGLDLIQVPGNLVDRRLLDHPLLAEFHRAGAQVHVRSAYLQGLLLADPEEIPEHLAGLRPAVESLRRAAQDQGVSVIVLALAFLRVHPVVDAVLVGATSASEFDSTAQAWQRSAGSAFDLPDIEVPVDLVDPRGWAALER